MAVPKLMTYAEIRKIIPAEVKTDEQFNKLKKETNSRESVFLLHKKGREIWHGMAYGALTTNKQKTDYRDRFQLPENTIKVWARRIKKDRNGRFLDKYPGSHIDVVNELVPPGVDQEPWLKGAKTAASLRAKLKKKFHPTPPKTTVEKIQTQGERIDDHLNGIRKAALAIRELVGHDPVKIKALAGMGLGSALQNTVTVLLNEIKNIEQITKKTKQIGE